MGLTRDQAIRNLQQRVEARDNLLTFARYVDIPGVPQDEAQEFSDLEGDHVYDVIETPLAGHHRLLLYGLQALVDGDLRYDTRSMRGVIATPDGLVVQAPGGQPGGGVPTVSDKPPLETPSTEIVPYVRPVTESIDSPQKIKLLESKSAGNTGEIPEIAGQDIQSWKVCHRMMIMLPPGAAKSTYSTVLFPSWDMGRNPHHEIILTGWGDPICKRHGKRSRQLCTSPAYRSVFGTHLDPNTRAAEDWALTNGSTYKSSGINSGVAGFRCDGLIWDDLTKNRKEADSPGIRGDVYNAYIDDARSRKKPHAWEVGIGTRWHEDEIMGRILPEGYNGESGYMECRDGNVWYVVCIPAQCEREDDPLGREIGEYIWPEWFGEDYWNDKKINPRSWSSLYQQRPAPEEGIHFKREWFRTYTSLPEGCDYYIGIDPAVTETEDADATAILTFAVDSMARIYLIDEWVKKRTMDKWIDALYDMAEALPERPIEIVGEKGVIRNASEPYLARVARERKRFYRFEWVTRHANKPAMSRGAAGLLSAGQIYVPENSVGQSFIDELLRFPAGTDDHRVDAFVNLTLRLEVLWESTPPKKEERPKITFGGDMKIKDLMPERFPKKKSRWAHSRTRH